jgi:cytochrome c biogenesis protein CcdA
VTPEFAAAVATALWLGILTSISPCPLATNVAAVSYVARRMDRPWRVVLSASAYSLGRALAYALVSAVVVLGLLSVPGLSLLLQRYMNKILGPLLVLVGMYLLDLVPFGISSKAGSDELRQKAADGGAWGAALLGVLFALSFCPVSAGLFFGGLIPLAIGVNSRVLLPALYGIGTGLPVLALAILLAAGARWVGRTFNLLTAIERISRPVAGAILILAGIYLVLVHLVGVSW